MTARKKAKSRVSREVREHGVTIGRLLRSGKLDDRLVGAAEEIARIYGAREAATLSSFLGRSHSGGGGRDMSRLEAAEWSADAFLHRYEPWRIQLEERWRADEERYRIDVTAAVVDGGSPVNVRKAEANIFALTLLVIHDGYSCGKADKLMGLRNGTAQILIVESLELFCTLSRKFK